MTKHSSITSTSPFSDPHPDYASILSVHAKNIVSEYNFRSEIRLCNRILHIPVDHITRLTDILTATPEAGMPDLTSRHITTSDDKTFFDNKYVSVLRSSS